MNNNISKNRSLSKINGKNIAPTELLFKEKYKKIQRLINKFILKQLEAVNRFINILYLTIRAILICN